MSNFIQCNTETGEVIYVNLDLVLKVRVLKSKGTQITFVNGDKQKIAVPQEALVSR